MNENDPKPETDYVRKFFGWLKPIFWTVFIGLFLYGVVVVLTDGAPM